MGDDNIGIGASAIRDNQASGLIAIGQDAGINAQTDDQLIITQRDGTRRMEMDLTTGDLDITGKLQVDGNSIEEVGGTTDASSGAIRLANNSWMTSRNNADDGDVNMWKVNTSDEVETSGAVKMNSGNGASNGIKFNDQGGGTEPAVFVDSNGEVIAQDDDGNITQLT
jgi:hypothetical protein